MTHDEAMKMASELKDYDFDELHQFHDLRTLCDYILSGDHKREIENAAYAQVASRLDARAQNYRDTATKATSDPETIPLLEAAAVASENGAEQIRALIQPPAQQKENGE